MTGGCCANWRFSFQLPSFVFAYMSMHCARFGRRALCTAFWTRLASVASPRFTRISIVVFSAKLFFTSNLAWWMVGTTSFYHLSGDHKERILSGFCLFRPGESDRSFACMPVSLYLPPQGKSSNWHFLDFHFFAKKYNLVNALSCVLVIFLEKKLNAWKRVFSVLQKAV